MGLGLLPSTGLTLAGLGPADPAALKRKIL